MALTYVKPAAVLLVNETDNGYIVKLWQAQQSPYPLGGRSIEAQLDSLTSADPTTITRIDNIAIDKADLISKLTAWVNGIL